MSTGSDQQSQNSSGQSVSDAYDREDAIKKLGSEALLKKIANLFLSNSASHMDTISQSIQDGDSETLERSAHTFASSMAYLSAENATRIGRAMEEMGRIGDMSEVEQAYASLKSEVDRLEEALKQLLQEEG